MIDLEIIDHLVCPNCRSEVKAGEETIACQSAKCGMEYPVREGIPIMLIGGGEKFEEESGYYPKITGGTMEDNPDSEFVRYDTRIRTHYLKRYLAGETRAGLVLDLCCSKAPFSPYLKSLGYSGRIFGADLLFEQLRVAKARDVKAVQANALFLPFPDAHFATVIFTEALVHLMKREDQERVFSEIRRVLKKDGCLIMTVTSIKHAAMMAILKDIDYLKSDHCTYFSTKEIKELAGRGLEMENFDAFGFYPYVRGSTKNSNLCYLLDRLLNNPLTRSFGMVYYYKYRRL